MELKPIEKKDLKRHYDCQIAQETNKVSLEINIGKYSGKTLSTQIAGHSSGKKIYFAFSEN